MEQTLPIEFAKTVEFTIPEFDGRPAIILDMNKIYNAESRMVDAKVVNPAIYGELEVLFTQGESQARQLVSVVGYEITRAKKTLRRVKSELILDDWQDYKRQHAVSENATNRDAFLELSSNYVNAQDRVDMLEALEALIDGKVKIFQEVRRHMRKQIDIKLKSIGLNKY